MFRQSILAFFLVCQSALGASTVDIRLFTNNADCQGASAYQCTDINANTCCSNAQPGTLLYKSALFNGLEDDQVPEQGVAFRSRIGGASPCGSSCNAQYGANLCVSCPTGSFKRLSGAQWINLNQRRDDSVECVAPDTGIIYGHSFNITDGVPSDIVNRLIGLLENPDGSRYEDMPPDLLEYEIGNVTASSL